jgi:hypothetical protein
MLVEDDAAEIAEAVRTLFKRGQPAKLRSAEHELYIERLARLNPSGQWSAEEIRDAWKETAR